MYIFEEEIDTNLAGKKIMSIKGFKCENPFKSFENQYVRDYKPCYVSCKIEINDLPKIHLLEENGFQLIEIQLKLRKKINKKTDFSKFPYYYKKVDSTSDLEKIKGIASCIFTVDRFSKDTFFNKSFSGARYQKFIEKSYNTSNEYLYKMCHKSTNKIVAFGTHKRFENKTALILLGGVISEHSGFGLGAIHEHLALNEFFVNGIKEVTTHVSAINKPILDLQISGFGYKIYKTFAIYRKIY